MKRKYDYEEYSYLKEISGIYEFYNLITHKRYIGRSQNIYQRIGEHLRHSNNNNDSNYNSHFYKALRKYPMNNWQIRCIYKSDDINELINKERQFIIQYNTVTNGYNSTYETDTAPSKKYEKHINAKLSNEDVVHIRNEYEKIKSPKEVYQKYKNKIAYPTFLNVWRGNSWKGIRMEVYTEENKRKHFIEGNKNKIYELELFQRTRDCVYEIRKMFAEEKLSPNEVYQQFQFLNRNTFNDIWYGRTFQQIYPESYIEVLQRGRKYIRRGNNKGGKNENTDFKNIS